MDSSVARTALASILSLAILAALPIGAFTRGGSRKGEHEAQDHIRN